MPVILLQSVDISPYSDYSAYDCARNSTGSRTCDCSNSCTGYGTPGSTT